MTNSARLALNMFSSIATYAVLIALNLVSRAVFNKTLGITAVGVDTLFKSIISFLSLLELGVGTGLLHKLYEPLSRCDYEQTAVILQFYRRCYRRIIAAIIVLGTAVCLVLPLFIKQNEYPSLFLQAVLLLYIADTAVSFMQSEKRAMLIATQKNYYVNLYNVINQTAMVCVQIVLLYYISALNSNYRLYAAFAAYAACKIFFRFTENLFVFRKYRLLFKNKFGNIKVKKMPHGERDELMKKVVSMLCHKIRWFSANMSAPIIISVFVGVAANGIYGNYTLITSTLLSLSDRIFSCASVNFGLLAAKNDHDWLRRSFNAVYYLNFLLFSVFTVGVLCVITPFIRIWIGIDPTTGEYMLFSSRTLVLLCIHFYTVGMRKALNMARDGCGLYSPDRGFALAEGIITIAVSCVAAPVFGVDGVLFANILCGLAIPMWTHPIIVYKYVLHESVWRYYKKYLLYFVLTCGDSVLAVWLCSYVSAATLVGIVLRGVIIVFVCFTINLLLFVKTPEIKYLLSAVRRLAKR